LQCICGYWGTFCGGGTGISEGGGGGWEGGYDGVYGGVVFWVWVLLFTSPILVRLVLLGICLGGGVLMLFVCWASEGVGVSWWVVFGQRTRRFQSVITGLPERLQRELYWIGPEGRENASQVKNVSGPKVFSRLSLAQGGNVLKGGR